MRRAWVGCIAVGVAVIVLAGAMGGCEDEEQQQPASTQPEGPSQPQFQRLKLATQPATLPMPPADWQPSTEPAFSTTRPATAAATTTTGASASEALSALGALDDPESAVRHFLEICGGKVLPGIEAMRTMIVEPPPEAELVAILNKVRRPLTRGATWEILQTHKRGTAAVVLYKTTYRGRTIAGDVKLYQGRDDRWRIIVADLTPSRYTPSEKEAMALEVAWARQRLGEINAQLATSQPAGSQPATQATTQQTAP